MTWNSRRFLLRTLFIGGMLLAGLYLFTLVYGVILDNWGYSLNQKQYWWFFYTEPTALTPLISFISLGLLVFTVIIISGVFGFYFKRSSSPEIFFFRLFLHFIPFHTFRLLNTLLLNRISWFSSGVLLTRFDIFIHMLILFSLFSTSLFTLGVNFQKYKFILLTYFLVSLSVAAHFPINMTATTQIFLYKISEESLLFLIFMGLLLLTVLNYILIAYRKSSREYLFVALYVFLIGAGYEMVYFTVFPTVVPGFIFFVLGCLFYGKNIYKLNG